MYFKPDSLCYNLLNVIITYFDVSFARICVSVFTVALKSFYTFGCGDLRMCFFSPAHLNSQLHPSPAAALSSSHGSKHDPVRLLHHHVERTRLQHAASNQLIYRLGNAAIEFCWGSRRRVQLHYHVRGVLKYISSTRLCFLCKQSTVINFCKNLRHMVLSSAP